jgi:hypothetical protein
MIHAELFFHEFQTRKIWGHPSELCDQMELFNGLHLFDNYAIANMQTFAHIFGKICYEIADV